MAESTLARSIQYCNRLGFRPHVAWKWLAGAYCLYSAIVAYLGTMKVCGHDQFDVCAHGVGQLLGQIDRRGLVPDHAEHAGQGTVGQAAGDAVDAAGRDEGHAVAAAGEVIQLGPRHAKCPP